MGLYKRGGVWHIQYFVNGKRVRKAMGTVKRNAEAALEGIRMDIRAGKYRLKEYPKTTIEDLCKKYREWAKGHLRSVSYKTHLPIIEEYFKKRLISTITEADVESFRKERMDTPTRSGGKRKNSTLNRELATLARLFNLGIKWDLTDRNPAAKAKPLPETRGRTRFLSVEEAGRLLEAAPRHLRPILIMALETGMRRGEIMNLRWSDVDRKNGTIFIAESKNGCSRHVPMSNRLRKTLDSLPRRLGTDHVFTGHIRNTPAEGKRRRPLNQPIGKVGEPFHDVRTSFERACMKAGIENFRFHDLRHTAASHMVMAGVPMKTVGEILGHKAATMTERYSHLTPEHKRKAVEMLPDWEGAKIGATKLPQIEKGVTG
ncbi:MAG: site-specific integrase [Deltaproteobacteria bacterium]